MLTFFTDFYPDELFYSAFARYHYYSGNPSTRDTLKDLFGTDNVIPSTILPSHLEYFASQFISPKYTPENVIRYNSVLPFYFLFMENRLVKKTESKLIFNSASGVINSLGIAAGSVCRKEELHYCPICMIEDVEQFGEPYFHRVHQVDGYSVCVKHSCKLLPYKVKESMTSRLLFIRFDQRNIKSNLNPIFVSDDSLEKELSESIENCFALDYYSFDLKEIQRRYLEILNCRGYLTLHGHIRKKRLKSELVQYYGVNNLENYDSFFGIDNEYTWVDKLIQGKRIQVHPIRHLLFMRFLLGDAKAFFYSDPIICRPFGEAPWPCLNPVSAHYKDDVVTDMRLSIGGSLGRVVGTFKCDCGFEYSREGPDRYPEDRFRLGRIKEFGHEWESKLEKLLQDKNLSLRAISRMMHCDPMTVKKFKEASKSERMIMISKQDDLKEVISSKKLRQKMLDMKIKTPKSSNKQPRVDWNTRDEVIRECLRKEFEYWIKFVPMRRITKTLLGRSSGKLSLLEKSLIKMPKTEKYLVSVCETLADYHVRKVKTICRKKLKNDVEIAKWQVYKEAGLRKEYYDQVDETIDKFITLQRLE